MNNQFDLLTLVPRTFRMSLTLSNPSVSSLMLSSTAVRKALGVTGVTSAMTDRSQAAKMVGRSVDGHQSQCQF